MLAKKQQDIGQHFNAGRKLFLGLGNPGKTYQDTYHTIGVHAVMTLAHTHQNGFAMPSRKHFSFIEKDLCVFALSQTYMNESGIAAREALAYFSMDPHELVVVHDDSDMRIGTYKLSYNQRSAGHHGIDSIISELKTAEFYRLKIGIRPEKELRRKKAEEFVLKKISRTDFEHFHAVFTKIKQELKI